jgi:hypothetical protein
MDACVRGVFATPHDENRRRDVQSSKKSRKSERADARTRTEDPFITSELPACGVMWPGLARSGLAPGVVGASGLATPRSSVSGFSDVWARIGHRTARPARARASLRDTCRLGARGVELAA